jgi:hypothetical protein
VLPLLHASFIFSTLLFAGISFVLQREGPGETALREPFIAVAVCLVLAAFLLRRTQLRPDALAVLKAREQGPDALARLYFTLHLASVAMVEAIGLLGLVLVVLGAPWLDGLPFFVLALLALVVNRPRAVEFEHMQKGGI